jgi:hypothetical protein
MFDEPNRLLKDGGLMLALEIGEHFRPRQCPAEENAAHFRSC